MQMINEIWSRALGDNAVTLFAGAEMNYNTALFFLFLPLFLGIYFLLRGQKAKRNWILCGSIVFYICSGWDALIIVAFTAIITYATTRKIGKIYSDFEMQKGQLTAKEQVRLFGTYKKKAKKYFLLALAITAAVWIFVKVGRLIGLEEVSTFSEVFTGRGIIVPLGISYYSLSAIGYMLDVYWRKAKAEHNVINLFTVMTYFPHIMQGPISKYSELLEQLKKPPRFEYTRVCHGLQLMLWGYIKKMVIADRLVLYTSAVFSTPESFAGVEILIAIVLCVFQLYADFSGCMDIVRGISQAMGIELAENFRQPLFAKNAQEFWARWHITLGAWTKEYIYLPIAMNPKFIKKTSKLKKAGKTRQASFLKAFCPLVAVWLFTGLWHGNGGVTLRGGCIGVLL